MRAARHAIALLLALLIWAGAASASEYADLIRSQESGGNYGAMNTGGGTAAGAFQITAGTLASLGYVEHTGGSVGNWNNYVWTAQSQSQGVGSLHAFLNTPAGHALQDQAFATLTARNWAAMSAQTRGLVDQTVGGVTFSESGLLTAAHFLGAGALNEWVASGFDPTVFPQSYLTANGFDNYAELQSYLMNRIGAANGTAFAGALGGFGNGGTYAATDGFPGFGPKRPILIRETPPFQGERTTLGAIQ